jgi:hypothetical protein
LPHEALPAMAGLLIFPALPLTWRQSFFTNDLLQDWQKLWCRDMIAAMRT